MIFSDKPSIPELNFNPFGDNYQVIILGNGFDLQCGLESSYGHFYNSSFADKSNLFLALATNENYDWSDIEKLIEKVLCLVSEFNAGILKRILQSTTAEGIFHNFISPAPKDITMSESEYLALRVEISKSLWTALNSSANQCNLNKNEFQIADIYKYLKTQLNNFENNFKSYIKSCLNTNSESYQSKSETLAKILKETNTRINNNEDLHTRWFSFNYTKPSVMKDDLNNVHGCIDSDIIFGIDVHGIDQESREKRNAHDDFMEFTKTYRLLYEEPKSSNRGIPDNIKYIKFYGHSLSEADYSYFQSIFDSAQIYSKDVSLYFYFTELDENVGSRQRMMESKKVFKLIRTYGKTMNNKDHGKNLLHKLIIEDRLFLDEIPSITDDLLNKYKLK